MGNNMLCPKCKIQMDNLGNLSGMVLTSFPPKWTDTYICETCKIRKDVRVTGRGVESPKDLSEYETFDGAVE